MPSQGLSIPNLAVFAYSSPLTSRSCQTLSRAVIDSDAPPRRFWLV